MLKRLFLSALYFLSIALGVGHKTVHIISTPLLYPLPIILTSQKLELVIRICQWNFCQSFRKPITQSTHYLLWKSYVFEIIKNFYINYSFLNWIWRSLCFKLDSIITESSKCLPIFPAKKQKFYYLTDLRN